jgi:hypothetical protein
MYDPIIARFTGVDPISDEFPWASSYNYAENEPVGSIDLWGLQRFLVINNYVNQELVSTRINSVRNASGNIVDLGAIENGSNILELNLGDLPEGLSASNTRNNFTSDEEKIMDAGIDQRAPLGNGGFGDKGGYSFPGSVPESDEEYTASLAQGNYEDETNPEYGTETQNYSVDIASGFAFVVQGSPSYQVTGIQDRTGRGTSQILGDVVKTVSQMRTNGGVTSINLRADRGARVSDASASAIQSSVNSNLLGPISVRTGVNRVSFTFRQNVNNTIRINGYRNVTVITGYSKKRILKP